MRPEQHIQLAETFVEKAGNPDLALAHQRQYVELAKAYAQIAQAKIALERLRSKP